MKMKKFIAIGLMSLLPILSYADNVDTYFEEIESTQLKELTPTVSVEDNEILQNDLNKVKDYFTIEGSELLTFKKMYVVNRKNKQLDEIAFTNRNGDIYISETVARMEDKYRHFIIAHELAHIYNDHSNKVAEYIKGFIKSSNVSDSMSVFMIKLNLPLFNKLKIQQEYEADALATKVMVRMGYSTKDVEDFFNTYDKAPPDPYSNHPSPVDRKREVVKF